VGTPCCTHSAITKCTRGGWRLDHIPARLNACNWVCQRGHIQDEDHLHHVKNGEQASYRTHRLLVSCMLCSLSATDKAKHQARTGCGVHLPPLCSPHNMLHTLHGCWRTRLHNTTQHTCCMQ
jgi:hypothetical protein